MKNKKQFTLIELIIVIVVIGILAGMALPKFNGVVRNAKLAAMINDKEVLEKTLVMYYQKNDTLPLLNEDEELIASNNGISLTKIVLAEETQNGDMNTIYESLKETLSYYNDSEETLYRIDLSKIKDNLSKDIKYGHKKHDKDFYVYSLKTGNVYYYDYVINGNGTMQHTEYDTLLKETKLTTKVISPSLSGEETIINNKPIIELTTNLEDVTTDTIINWEYSFVDEDATPTKISFTLNDIEYDSFNNIPTKLNEGDYTIKFKAQDSKGLWSEELSKSFIVEKKIIINKNSIALGGNHTMKIGEDGYLYAWGSNSSGQLALKDPYKEYNPQKINLPNGEKPKEIMLGYSYSMCITENGNIYSWGNNSYRQLGVDAFSSTYIPTLLKLPTNEKVKSMELGFETTMCITENGDLYSWGNNKYYVLGRTDSSYPNKVTLPNGEKVSSVSLGMYHAMAITEDGKLYAWGNNDYGKLGLGHKSEVRSPQLVNLPNGEKPQSIALGFDFSLVLTTEGNLYSCGDGTHGELGYGYVTESYTFKPVKIPDGEKVTMLSSEKNHSLALTEKGNLYYWGAEYGLLGSNYSSVLTPKLINIPTEEKIVYIYAGGESSGFVTEKGSVYLWGNNTDGELGRGNFTKERNPIKINLP